MNEAIMTGILTLAGVIIGGLFSWLVAVYTNRKKHTVKILEKQQALCLNMLANLNEMIDKLPKNANELEKFNNYLLSEFSPKSKLTFTEEMLYLNNDIRTTYLVIQLFAMNDFTANCDFNIVCDSIIKHRNIFLEILKKDLKICYKKENLKKKEKRYNKLYKKHFAIDDVE